MSSKPIAPAAPAGANGLTDATLKAGPARLLAFLQALGDPAIRAKFNEIGWSDAQTHEAWDLLLELKAATLTPAPPATDPTADAIAACEAWARTGLVRARAMMQLRFPERVASLFADIRPGKAKGMAAVLDVATFLDRRETLDRDALAALEEGGVTNDVATHLAALVRTAQRGASWQTDDVDRAATARTDTLRKIHAWLAAWSEMARTVITRRDHLIRLGLAKRRAKSPTSSTTAKLD